MPREYRHIKQYEKEIFELREQGLTQRQIGERFGLSFEKIHEFFKRHNRNQRKISSGEVLKPTKRWNGSATISSAIEQSYTIKVRIGDERTSHKKFGNGK